MLRYDDDEDDAAATPTTDGNGKWEMGNGKWEWELGARRRIETREVGACLSPTA
jgi:hypothetical protein